MERWQNKRILVLGSSYPSHSIKYTEIACTGGIDADTCKMVRLQAVPMRYMKEGQRFKKFQFIYVKLQPSGGACSL